MKFFDRLLTMASARFSLLRVLVCSTLIVTAMLSWTPAHAVTLTASTNVGLAYSPSEGLVLEADDHNQSIVTGSAASALAERTFDYNVDGNTTIASGSASASASEADLHVYSLFSATDFQPGLLGEGFSVTSYAALTNNYYFYAIGNLFASPVFHLSGTLSASGDLATSVSMGAGGAQVFARTVTSADGLVTLDEIVAAPAVSSLLLSGFTVSLQSSVTGNLSSMTPGNHDGLADFSHTLTLLGFALYEDQAMTTPFTGPVTITTGDGLEIPVIAAVPVPAAAWLLCSGLMTLLPVFRRGKI